MKTAAEDRRSDDEGLDMMAPTQVQYLVCNTQLHTTLYAQMVLGASGLANCPRTFGR